MFINWWELVTFRVIEFLQHVLQVRLHVDFCTWLAREHGESCRLPAFPYRVYPLGIKQRNYGDVGGGQGGGGGGEEEEGDKDEKGEEEGNEEKKKRIIEGEEVGDKREETKTKKKTDLQNARMTRRLWSTDLIQKNVMAFITIITYLVKYISKTNVPTT